MVSATVTASVSSTWLSEGNVVDVSAVAMAVGVSHARVSNVRLARVRDQAALSGATGTQRGMHGQHALAWLGWWYQWHGPASQYYTQRLLHQDLAARLPCLLADDRGLAENTTDYLLSFTLAPVSNVPGPSSETLLSSLMGAASVWIQAPIVQRVPGEWMTGLGTYSGAH